MPVDGKTSSRAKHIDFIFFDILATEISYLSVFYIMFNVLLKNQAGNYEVLNLFILIIYIVIIFIQPFHSGILRRGYFQEFKSVFIMNVEKFVVLLTILFALKYLEGYSRMLLGSYFVLDTILTYLFRIMRKKRLHSGLSKNGNKIHLILVTYRENAKAFKEDILSSNPGLYVVDRFMLLDKEKLLSPIDNTKVMYRADMPEFLRTHIVDEVFIGSKSGEIQNIGKLVSWFLSMGVGVHVMTDVLIHDVPNMHVDKIGSRTCISSSITPITPEQQLLKRIMDIMISIVGIIFTGILFVIFAPIIKHQSPGPVFFAQERVGLNGRKFRIYKFRTMEVDAEAHKKELLKENEMKGNIFKLSNDPRVIPIGKFMRKTCLDEFPQFFNVLKGDMSVVGTRPPTVDEFESYRPHHMARLSMKPGITGLWQISKTDECTDFEEVVRLDNNYISNFSMGKDIEIIAKTIGTMIRGKGSG